jgi:hypothetical protein
LWYKLYPSLLLASIIWICLTYSFF